MNRKNTLNIFSKRTLALDLALRLATVTTIIIVLLGAAYYYVSATQAQRDLSQQAVRRIDELANVLAIPVWNLDDASIQQIAAVYLETENVVALRVLDEAGETIYESPTDEQNTIFETRPIAYNQKQVGQVEIKVSTKQVSDLRQNIMFLVLMIVVAMALAILLTTWLLLQRYLELPLSTLTEGINSFAGGNYGQRLNPMAQEEFNTIATQFNAMAGQIQARDQYLEQRVADRTKALATSGEVSRRLSTILNKRQLVIEVVEQVKNAFDYYHAQIYLLDAATGDLIMAGGTGDAGASMLGSGHKISKGKGLVGRAAESNTAVLVSDTSKDPDWLPNPLLPDTKSEAAIPISVGEAVMGVLDVQHNLTDGLKQEDVDLLQSIASQVAIAMQNIASAEIIAKRATQLQTVSTINTAAATIRDTEEMLATVVKLTQHQFGFYHAHIFIHQPQTAELKIAACGWRAGEPHEGSHETTVLSLEQQQSLVVRAARTRQPVILNDVRREPDWLPNPLLPETAAELAVPLIVGDQLLGVLDVQSERRDAFTEEDASILTTLATQTATALQNTASYVQAQRQAERETKLNDISQKIQSTATIELALQTAARELGHALGRKPTLVALDAPTRTGQHNTIDQQRKELP